MTTAPEILIVGATGSTGRAVSGALATEGIAHRAMSRDTTRVTGELATPVRGDLDDAQGVREALNGVRAAYLVTPSTEAAETQQRRFLDEAVAAGVEHVVLLSQLGADIDSPVRFLRYHAAVENHAEGLGIGISALRPNLFMQGLLALAETVRRTGTLPAPIGSAPVSVIDVRDIGEVAANALIAPTPLGVRTLTGPESLTHAELADHLSTVTGRRIRFEDVDPRQFAEVLAPVLPTWQIEGLLEDYAHYARGEATEVTSAVPDLLGRPARDFRRFAVEHADVFRVA
ncbi:NmrA family NAD(P)-binding protein [Brachybacterium sacelli]|uniref:Uncharacterized protein YbjT (DUF2867 family) n=1 Tax=Brachybacterium sacelli TaxID=173364 RepID=A0ABS4X4E1_9MICO|nr:NmrA family NAD(P)-binding protein [Brachybacterium sacelli]MBP2383322.1 uncharacterized protein YbjT (DUF2867 family) [Brachybacterium sacelli]